MFEDLKKALDKGLDVAFMNAEKLAQAARDLAKENKLTREEAKKLYDYLVEKSDETRSAFEKEVQERVKALLKKMDIPTREELNRLEARIKKLEPAKKGPVRAKAAPRAAKTVKVKTK